LKSILITGCSSGIGYDSAFGLKEVGWRVFASCRSGQDCNRLSKMGLETVQLDYANESSINAALQEVLEKTDGTLDALFNNGAFASPGAVEDLPTEALKQIFETNFFGYHELTRKVIPVMRRQGHGRIVNCSSVLGFVTLPWRGAYNASKFALEGLTHTLRIEMRDTPIKIILIEPGPITSDIRKNAIPHFEKWIDWESSPLSEKYRKVFIPRLYKDGKKDRFELPASAVTKKLMHALEAKNPKACYYVTTSTYLAAFLKAVLPIEFMDRLLAKV
jgi:NAD(P)-dependent dehydrogenase (short-subunit alcohol dehydrogenase family)